MKTTAIALVTTLCVFFSCNSDEQKPQNTSRTLRYELTGNFTGSNMTAAYTTPSGGTASEQITALPWSKEITYNATVGGASLAVTGGGGTAGQKVTLVVKIGGIQVGSPVTATADALGTFSIAAPAVFFAVTINM